MAEFERYQAGLIEFTYYMVTHREHFVSIKENRLGLNHGYIDLKSYGVFFFHFVTFCTLKISFGHCGQTKNGH